jgi:outer membrane protein assembly factor BamB
MKKHISLFSLLVSCCMLALFLASCGGGGSGGSAFAKPGDGGTGGGGNEPFGTSKWSTGINAPTGTGIGPAFPPPFISSPAIAPDGTVYVGSADHFLYALKSDGTIKWKYETGSDLLASPAIGSDGTVYIGSGDRQIYAINPNGTLKWIVPTKSVFTSSAAIASDGTIYVAGTNIDRTIFSCVSNSSCSKTITQACGPGFPPCPTDETCVTGQATGYTVIAQLGDFYSLTDEGSQGKIKWTVGLSGEVHSSPAIASDGTIYIGSNGDFVFDRSNVCDNTSVFPPSAVDSSRPVNGHFYAINPDGTLKWAFNTLGHVISSPAIGSDGTIYVGSQHPTKFYGKDRSTLVDESSAATGFMYAINPNGTPKCLRDLFGDIDSSPAIGSDSTIYVGSDNFHVYALDPNCSLNNLWPIKWVEPTRDKIKSSPAVASDGTIYIGSNDKSLYAFNPDGMEKSRVDAGGSVNSGPSIGADGTIYFTSSDSKLIALSGTKGIGLADSSWPKFRHDLINNGRR